jgi:hypothetical protein
VIAHSPATHVAASRHQSSMAATTCSGRVMTGTWPAPRITTSLEPGIAWVAISELARGMMASSSPWMMRVGSRTPSSLSATRSGPHRAARAYPDGVGGLAGQRSSCAPLCGPGEATRRTVKPAATMNVPLWILVLGAGSAGAALAARLLEQASARVLLVEAGPDYRTVDTPPEIQGLNWPESPAPRPLLAGVTARPTDVRVPVLYVRGPGVGGNSAINAAGAVRRVPGALMFGGGSSGPGP